jgi:hypothetical protein
VYSAIPSPFSFSIFSPSHSRLEKQEFYKITTKKNESKKERGKKTFHRVLRLLLPKSYSGHLTWDGLVLWLVGGKLSAHPGRCDDPLGRGQSP